MKKTNKIIAVGLSAATVFGICGGLSITSAKDISVEIDGTPITFDVNPQISDGRTLVPLRKIFEEIGALVKWDAETQTVTARKNSKTVSLAIGSNELSIDKGKTDDAGNPVTETVELDVAAQVISDRTLVPARAISESFGLNVDWDEENRKVIITSKDDEDDSWKENIGTIDLTDLTYTGDGVEISDNRIVITKGGDYTVTGTLEDGNITISTEEKVKLRLDNASVTSSSNPCIYAENADKLYITLSENTENILIAKNSESGAIYSKDNLEIKGKGSLKISSETGHGIKSSDNLTIENGNITVDAYNDGIHVNDTFKMTGGKVDITAIGDGIDSESIVIVSGGELTVKTNGVPITQDDAETAETADVPEARHGGMPQESIDVEFEKSSKGINADWMISITGGDITVNSASHAIHSADEIEISGGSFNLNSEYEKGVSAHGNLTVSNSETYINVTKSTEGLESKKTATINDGVIRITASDDGINATGGRSGDMFGGGGMPGGGKQNRFNERNNTDENFQAEFDRNDFGTERPAPPEGEESFNKTSGTDTLPGGNIPDGDRVPPQMSGEEGTYPPEMPNGNPSSGNLPSGNLPNGNFRDGDFMQRPDGGENFQPNGENRTENNRNNNMSDCLIINGGDIEIFAEDDCLDSNGNLIINGGTIKAIKVNGTFTGANSVLDPDGTISISEGVTLIAVGSGGMQGNLTIPQNTITVYSDLSHIAGDGIVLSDENGNVIAEYTPNGNYTAVLITSPEIKTGKTYTVSMGDETETVTISSENTTVGTQKYGDFGGMKRNREQTTMQ